MQAITTTMSYSRETKMLEDRPQPSAIRMGIRTVATCQCWAKYYTDIIQPVLEIIHPRETAVGND